VSPQVWAWRQSRVHRIRESVDLVLCLLPFEKRFYDEQGVAAEFVGHPLADAIALEPDRGRARAELDLPADAQIVALLPGSRRGEVTRLAGDFAKIAQWLAAQRPNLELSHRWRTPSSRTFRRGARTLRAAGQGALVRRACAGRSHRGGRGTGGFGNRQPGSGVVQAPDGGGLPFGCHDGLGAPAIESGEIQVFCTAESACRSPRRRRVFSS